MFMQLNRHTCISNLYAKCASYTILKKNFLWSQQGDGNVHNLCCSLSSKVGKTGSKIMANTREMRGWT